MSRLALLTLTVSDIDSGLRRHHSLLCFCYLLLFVPGLFSNRIPFIFLSDWVWSCLVSLLLWLGLHLKDPASWHTGGRVQEIFI